MEYGYLKKSKRSVPEFDLFNPTDEPKCLAVNRAIECAVESWIAGDTEEAAHMFDMAEEFVHASPHYFEP